MNMKMMSPSLAMIPRNGRTSSGKRSRCRSSPNSAEQARAEADAGDDLADDGGLADLAGPATPKSRATTMMIAMLEEDPGRDVLGEPAGCSTMHATPSAPAAQSPRRGS